MSEENKFWLVINDWRGEEDLAFRDSEIEARKLYEERKIKVSGCYIILAKVIEYSEDENEQQ